MEEKCLIYYKGERGKLYYQFCRELEDIGFAYEKKIDMPSLDYDVARFSYQGNDLKKDMKKIKNLDNKIFIELISEYTIC